MMKTSNLILNQKIKIQQFAITNSPFPSTYLLSIFSAFQEILSEDGSHHPAGYALRFLPHLGLSRGPQCMGQAEWSAQ